MTTMFGIPKSKIHKVRDPYKPTEILKKFDEKTTAFVTVVGEKDKSRLRPDSGKYFQTYKGDPSEGYRDRGYVYAAPMSGGSVSGTEVRNGLSNGSDDQKKDFFKKRAYGKFNSGIFKMITDKLNEILEKMIACNNVRQLDFAMASLDNVNLIKKGYSQTVMMPYIDALDTFCFWFRQLWGESIGKKGLGSTPINSLGTVDQHSQLQLYLDGPKDKIITIIGYKKTNDSRFLNCKINKNSEATSKSCYIGLRFYDYLLRILKL